MLFSLALLFAILASVSFGLTNSIVRFADQRAARKHHALLVLFVAFLFLIVVFFFSGDAFPSAASLPWFVLAGFFAPGLAWLFRFTSMAKLGISVAGPLMAVSPVFSFFLAVLFLGEQLSVQILAGTAFILVGILLLIKKRSLSGKESLVWLPFAGALVIGVSVTSLKYALSISDTPFGGLLVVAAVGFLTEFLFVLFQKHDAAESSVVHSRFKHILPFVIGGLFTGVAILFAVLAFSEGDVVLVHPIIVTRMFFAMLFSSLLFRQDKPTKELLFSAVLVLIGTVLITAI